MEMARTSIGITIVIVFILALAWRVFNWVWLRPKRLEKFLKQQGLSGNSYKFLFGDIKEFGKLLKTAMSKPINIFDDPLSRAFPFSVQSIKKYGKHSFMWNGPNAKVKIMDPEMIKDVFSKIDEFQTPEISPLAKLVACGLASYEGEQWVKHRKIITPPFHLDKLKIMIPAFEYCTNQMLKKWENAVSEDGSVEMDVWPFLKNITGDVISRTAFGSSFEEGRKIFELLTEQAELAAQVLRSVNIPGWRFIPTKRNMRMKFIDKQIQTSLIPIIKKREKAMKEGESAKQDLLGLLIESNFKEINDHGNDKKKGMSIKEVIDECKLFYLAGQETSSVLLVWTMFLLSRHQEWQARARDEVLQVFGSGDVDTPTYDRLSRLKIVTMILHEVSRLFPPVTDLWRRVHKETTAGKFTLPKGAHLQIPVIFIHHDPELWGEDSKEFKPERFAEGVANATKNRAIFFPFGAGPRICLGMNFALIELKLMLAMILRRFSFELSPAYAHAPYPKLTLQPQYGVHMILHKL